MDEDDIVRRGYLGSTGRFSGRKWYILRRDSPRGRMRLDYYRNERAARNGDTPLGYIALQSVVGVTKRPKSETTFEIATNPSGLHAFTCASIAEADDWIDAVLGLATGSPTRRVASIPATATGNDLVAVSQSARNERSRFRVTAEDSPQLSVSACEMVVTNDDIQLNDVATGRRIEVWPINAVRRYGRNDSCFMFEAGRRCNTGEGFFTFSTMGQDSEEIYQLVHARSQVIARRAQERKASSDSAASSSMAARNYADPQEFIQHQQQLTEVRRASEPATYTSLTHETMAEESPYHVPNVNNQRRGSQQPKVPNSQWATKQRYTPLAAKSSEETEGGGYESLQGKPPPLGPR